MSLLELVFVGGVGAGPIIGFTLMLRRPDHTRWQLIVAAALGAGLPALVAVASAAAVESSASPGLVVYVLLAMAYGAFVGLCGVLARGLGVWLSKRQP